MISAIVCLYIIAAMAFDRFLYIYKPLRYEKIVTSFRMVVMLLVLCVILILAITLSVFLGQNTSIGFHQHFLSCVVDFSTGNIAPLVVILVSSVIPVLILVFCNVWLVVIVWRNIRAIYNVRATLSSSSERDSHQNSLYKTVRKKRQQKELHLIQVFAALLGSSLIFWLPMIGLIIYLLIVSAAPGEGPARIQSTFFVVFISQVAVYPIIETALIKDVREPLKKWLLCFCLRKGKSNVEAYADEERGTPCACCHDSCCGKFIAVLHAAMLDHSNHTTHSELDESQVQKDKLEMATAT